MYLLRRRNSFPGGLEANLPGPPVSHLIYTLTLSALIPLRFMALITKKAGFLCLLYYDFLHLNTRASRCMWLTAALYHLILCFIKLMSSVEQKNNQPAASGGAEAFNLLVISFVKRAANNTRVAQRNLHVQKFSFEQLRKYLKLLWFEVYRPSTSLDFCGFTLI